MLFEKTIRKKRKSPFYLEIFGGFIFNEFLALMGILGLGLIYRFGSVWVISILILFVAGALSTYLNMRHVISTVLRLQSDKKKNRIIFKDIIFVDYDLSFASHEFAVGYFYTFTHLFYLEPYIRIYIFNYFPEEKRIFPTALPKFYMEEAHFTYRKQKNYEKICAEYEKYEDSVNNGQVFDIPKKTIREYEDTNHAILYMTYNKMQEFKKLFELVNPPEFRITKYETSWVFISIEPIPGKEYPPEALECMEKINAMYP